MAETKTINLNVETNIEELTAKLNDVNSKLNQLLIAEQNDAKATRDLVNQKKVLQQQLNELNTVVKNNSDNIRTNTNNVGGLGNSINQISRELPAFTMNLNTGFLAISNNLPILFDEINKVKQANIELAATGQPTQSVFKALTSAIFSWGTALSIGVTLLTVYGSKIIDYFTKDNEQRKTNEDLIKAQNEALKKQNSEIAKESSHFVTLIEMLKQTNEGSKERNDLINKINKEYGTTLKNLKDERDFQNQLNDEVKNYLKYQTAKYALQANEEAIQNNLKTQWDLQSRINKLQEEQDKLLKKGALTKKETYETDDLGIKVSTGLGYANEELAIAYEKVSSELDLLKGKLSGAKDRFENYGKAALQSSNIIDKLTDGGKKYGKQLDETKQKEEEIKDLRNEIVDEQIKQIDNVNQREQTQLIVNAERRIKEINDSNATEKQKAELIKEIRTNLLNDLDKLDTDYYKKDLEAKKEADRLKVEQENAFQLQIEDIDEANFQARLQNSMSNQDYELEKVRQKYFTLEELAKGNAEQEKIIEEAKQRDITEINRRYNTKRWQMASQALSILSEATTLFSAKNEKDARAQFKIQKAFNLSAAIINTALAVTGALTAGGNPIKLATGMQFVEAGIAAAAGAVNIAKISATQFGSGSGSQPPLAPPPAGGTSVTSPNLSFSMQGAGGGIGQLLSGVLNQPIKAYVVSSDITNAQMLDAKAIKTSVL